MLVLTSGLHEFLCPKFYVLRCSSCWRNMSQRVLVLCLLLSTSEYFGSAAI